MLQENFDFGNKRLFTRLEACDFLNQLHDCLPLGDEEKAILSGIRFCIECELLGLDFYGVNFENVDVTLRKAKKPSFNAPKEAHKLYAKLLRERERNREVYKIQLRRGATFWKNGELFECFEGPEPLEARLQRFRKE